MHGEVKTGPRGAGKSISRAWQGFPWQQGRAGGRDSPPEFSYRLTWSLHLVRQVEGKGATVCSLVCQHGLLSIHKSITIIYLLQNLLLLINKKKIGTQCWIFTNVNFQLNIFVLFNIFRNTNPFKGPACGIFFYKSDRQLQFYVLVWFWVLGFSFLFHRHGFMVRDILDVFRFFLNTS